MACRLEQGGGLGFGEFFVCVFVWFVFSLCLAQRCLQFTLSLVSFGFFTILLDSR